MHVLAGVEPAIVASVGGSTDRAGGSEQRFGIGWALSHCIRLWRMEECGFFIFKKTSIMIMIIRYLIMKY